MARFSQNSSSNNSSSALNYVQVAGTQQTISSAPSSIIDLNITTTGKPVQISVTGEGANASAGSWLRLNLFRDGVEIGNAIQLESSAASENVPFAINFIDAVAAGTYNYSARVTSINGGNWTFGEAAGPVMNAVELTGFEGDRGPRGFTGDQGPQGIQGPQGEPGTGGSGTIPVFTSFLTYEEGRTSLPAINENFGWDNNGLWFGPTASNNGEASYPVFTNFTIPQNTPVHVEFDMVIDAFCSDIGLAIYVDGTTPIWAWDPDSSRIAAQFDCPAIQLYGLNGMGNTDSQDLNIPGPGTYRFIFDYNPTLESDQVTFAYSLDGNTLAQTSISEVLPAGDYRIGFASDNDGGDDEEPSVNPRSYIKNLVIKTNPQTATETIYASTLMPGSSNEVNLGNFTFEGSTALVSSGDMVLEADEGDSTVAAQIKISAGDIPINIAAYETDQSSYGTGDWATAEWQSDGNGAGQIVLTGITSIEQHLNNFNAEFQKILINNTTLVLYSGASYGGGNASIYVSQAPTETTTVTELSFIQSLRSGMLIDLDDESLDIVATNMSMDIITTGGNDINITSSDDLDLSAEDDIRFYTDTDGTEKYWSMDSEGRFNLPGQGYIQNPSDSSGDGNGYDTLKLVPDDEREEFDQYIVIDPTQPNHIHVRAGGTPDASQADLIIGAERTHVRVSDNYNYGGSVNVTSKVSPLTGNYLNTAPEAGSDMLVETTDLGFITEGTYVYVDNTKYYVTNLQTNTPIAGSSIITAAGANFVPNGYYTFITDQGENYWAFTSEGFLTGPAMGYVNVYGISNPATDTYLGINSSHKVTISGTDGEFLGDPEVANNQIATIGDVETAQGAGANGEVTRWSPNFQATGLSFTGSGTTYPTYNSHYVKNGRMVSFWIEIDLATVTNFGTGQYITALPFAPLAGTMNHFQAWANVDPAQNPDIAGHVVLQADHLANTTALDLHYLKQAGGANSPLMEAMFTQGAPATLTTSSKIYINGTYITAE
jgi:hypothetical protein